MNIFEILERLKGKNIISPLPSKEARPPQAMQSPFLQKILGAVQRLKEPVTVRETFDRPAQALPTMGPPAPPTAPPTATPTPTLEKMLGAQQPTATPTPIPGSPGYLGLGEENMSVVNALYNAIVRATEDPRERAILAALAQQESSGGVNLSNVSDREDSYGPYHINTRVRGNPNTGEIWTEEEARDWDMATQYVLDLIRQQGTEGMLRGWNSRAADYYAEEIPRSAETRRWYPQ